MMPKYALRPMTEEDLTLTWKWRNDATVREVSNAKDQIAWETHLNWFRSVKAERLVFTENDRTIGVVTLNGSNYWSFYLDPELPRRRGYGLIMLSLAMAYFKQKNVDIYAQVLTTNIASVELHKQIGFKQLRKKGSVIEFAHLRGAPRTRFLSGL